MATPILMANKEEKEAEKACMSLSCVAFVCRDPLIKTSLRPISLL